MIVCKADLLVLTLMCVTKHTSIVWQPSDQDRGIKYEPPLSKAFSWPAPGDTTAQSFLLASTTAQGAREAPAWVSPAPTLKQSTQTPYILHLDKHPIHTLWQRSFILKPRNPALSTHPSKLWDPLWYVRIEGMKHFALVLYLLDLRDSVKHLLPCLIEIYLH